MTQLTGTFQGTSQANTYLGEILTNDAVIIDGVFTGIAAIDLDIESLGGQDTIEAIVNINRNPTDPTEIIGIGIKNATLATGNGADTLTVNTLIVSDLFVSGGTGTASDSTGIIDSTIDMGNGQDVVTIDSLAVVINDDFAASVAAQSFGVVDSTLFLGSGSDEISITATIPAVRGNPSVAEATGVSNSNILADQGADTINIVVEARGSSVNAYGAAFGSIIEGGRGQDTITIFAESISSGESEAVGVGFGACANGGNGNDVITITAEHGASSAENATIKGVFLGGAVSGGRGADTIEVNVDGLIVGLGNANFAGVEKANVDGNEGSDTITINVSGRGGPNTTYVGVFQGTVAGGTGSDEIVINVTGRDYNIDPSVPPEQIDSVGVRQGTLAGGKGTDSFSVRGVSLDLDDAVVNGGSGADVFDTGIGEAQISGDGGLDLAKLDFFDASTMSIALLGADSVEIVGTQDKLGNAKNWTQTIADVEQYEFAGVVYNATDVVALLG